MLGSAITGAGATRTSLVTDLAIVLGVQIPACIVAVIHQPTLTKLWIAVAVAYAISGVTYVLVFRLAPWVRAAASTGGRAARRGARRAVAALHCGGGGSLQMWLMHFAIGSQQSASMLAVVARLRALVRIRILADAHVAVLIAALRPGAAAVADLLARIERPEAAHVERVDVLPGTRKAGWLGSMPGCGF